jgi:hypothetical protein
MILFLIKHFIHKLKIFYLKINQPIIYVNIPTDGATISVRKSASKKELLFVRLVST